MCARHYCHVDCPGHADYVKNMITGRPGVWTPSQSFAVICRQCPRSMPDGWRNSGDLFTRRTDGPDP